MQAWYCGNCGEVNADNDNCYVCGKPKGSAPMQEVCDYPECDRLISDDDRCRFHALLRQQTLGEFVSESDLEAAFMSSE